MKWVLLICLGMSFSLTASTVIFNINGYTMQNGSLHRFQAIEFDAGKVLKTFENNPQQKAGKNYIDGQGKTLLPGLIDAHGHVLGYGKTLSSVDLVGTNSLKEALHRIAKFAKANPDAKVISGRGWNQELWKVKQFPQASDLDALDIDKPIVLGRVDGHALWLNSAALAMAGITSNTKSPSGGEIILTSDKKPSGVLIDNAMDLVYAVMPKDTLASVKATLLKSLNKLASVGLTSVHDAGINKMTYDAYLELANDNALPIRVYAMLDVTDPSYQSMLENGKIGNDNHMLSIRSVKISSDGALGSRGAALHEPYSDQPSNRGLLLHTPEKLNALTQEAMEAGFQVNTHAIGDRANTLTLDSFATWIKKTGTQKMRHRVEHAQVVRPEEFGRFADLNVIASVQPTHATSDKNMAEDRLGSERIKGAYAWQTLYKSGAVVAGGSDFPVEPAEPMFGLHAAITRQDRENLPMGGWYANEAATKEQAFSMFTTDAAFAAHQEDIIGTLQPGYFADFILIDGDIFTISPKEIWSVSIEQTWVAGVRVH